MKRILRELKKTGAKIIFATTTPVSDNKEFLPGPMPPAHKNEDIKKYNQAILESFEDEDIVINNLFEKMYKDRDKFLSEDMIHPNEAGVKLLGRAVACAIKECPVSEKKHFEAKTRKIEMWKKPYNSKTNRKMLNN
jgi:lysophospholipase L1-like esterase